VCCFCFCSDLLLLLLAATTAALSLQVFGRTMVCRSRAIAEEVAAGGELDGITMEGDLVRRKGTISGGYSNAARSKYKLFREVRGAGQGVGVVGCERRGQADTWLLQVRQPVHRVIHCVKQVQHAPCLYPAQHRPWHLYSQRPDCVTPCTA
jgi:hypothetical protein